MLWNVGKSDVINQFKFAFKQKGFPTIISFYAGLIIALYGKQPTQR